MTEFPGPDRLGRGVVVDDIAKLPSAAKKWPIVVIDADVVSHPGPIADELHRHWASRLPVTVHLKVNADGLREPERNDLEVWQVDPGFEFARERLQFLVWANNYDHRADTPVWWHGRRATRIGATPGGATDVVLPDGTAAWCDGGPRGPVRGVQAKILHRETIDRGQLEPDLDAPLAANLADDQRAAVEHGSGPARVIAPAGSGKTTVLTSRLRHLVRDRGLGIDVVMTVAYNKRAADELRSRTEDLPSGVNIRTLNSLGNAIANDLPPFGDGGRRRTLLTEVQVREIMSTLVETPKRFGSDPYPPYLDALQLIRLGLVSPPEAEKRIPDAAGISDAFARYRQRLSDDNVMDFDEQIYLAVERLLREPDLRRRAQTIGRHLLVDEFQDLTPAHLLLLRLIAAPAYDVFGVGDDDQVIYGFAAASPEFLINYDAYFPGSSHHALTVNYRCPPGVVTAARHLLSHNERRIDKKIEPAPDRPAVVDDFEIQMISADAHAAYALKQLRSWNARGGAWTDSAVLTRVRSGLLAMQIHLVVEGIPCNTPLDAGILTRTGIRTTLAYLRIALAPDAIATADFAETIRRPSRKIRRDTIDAIVGRRNRTSVDELRRQVTRLPDGEADKLASYLADLEIVKAALSRGCAATIRAIRLDVGLGKAMDVLDASRGESDKSTHTDDLNALEQAASLQADPSTFEAWLRGVLRTRGNDDGVVLSTVHKVKGQEWPHVIVLGADASAFPHRLSHNTEEERRIFHVAITRGACNTVVIADRDDPSPFCAETLEPATKKPPPPRGRGRGKGRARGAPAAEPGPVVVAELHLEVEVLGGMTAIIVDWHRDGAVVASGKSRMMLPWHSDVVVGTKRRRLVPPTSAPQSFVQALRTWRVGRAKELAVRVDAVLSDAEVDTLAVRRPGSLEDLAQIPGFQGQRLEDVGDDILSVIDQVKGKSG